MKKKNIILAAMALASLLLLTGIAVAHGMGSFRQWPGGMETHHEKMEKIIEDGSYNELAALRDKSGFRMMPWVDSEEDFKEMQQMHETMEKFHEDGYGNRRAGMMSGAMTEKRAYCPMMS